MEKKKEEERMAAFTAELAQKDKVLSKRKGEYNKMEARNLEEACFANICALGGEKEDGQADLIYG